jgi:hypothetical protein
LRLTTPEREESEETCSIVGFRQDLERSITPSVIGGWPDSDKREMSDVWNFEEWEKAAKRLAEVREGRRSIFGE